MPTPDSKFTPGPLHVSACERHKLGQQFHRCVKVRTADGHGLEATLGDLFLHAASPDTFAVLRELLAAIDERPGVRSSLDEALLARARDVLDRSIPKSESAQHKRWIGGAP
jgi:hypothetical protein